MKREHLLNVLAYPVTLIKKTVTIITVTPDVDIDGTNIQVLDVCDSLYAQETFEVVIQANTYVIKYRLDQQLIINDGAAPVVPGDFDLYLPHLVSGTPIKTDTELKPEASNLEKMPLIWLMETYSETFRAYEDSIERDSQVKLYFLSSCNKKEWTFAQLKEKTVRPMRRLAELFEDAMEESGRFCTEDFQPKYTNYSNFGVYITNKGAEKSLMADNLSGVEMDGTLQPYKRDECEDC